MKTKKLGLLLHPNKIVLRRISKALGDNLMLTFLAREIKQAYPEKKVIIETEYPDLFLHNPNVDWVVKGKKFPFYVKATYLIGPDAKEPILDQMIKKLPFTFHRWEKKLDYIESNGITDPILARIPSDYIVICPAGKGTFAANRKEWGFDNFQTLIRLLPDIPVIQIGSPKDPLLENVIDFRTTGFPIRICAAIVKNSLAGVFNEGGFMHLANAVNRPSVIIYGGALKPETTGYEMHVNLSQKVDCGPCFTSDHPMTACTSMKCMKSISPETVFQNVMKIIENQLKKSRQKVIL